MSTARTLAWALLVGSALALAGASGVLTAGDMDKEDARFGEPAAPYGQPGSVAADAGALYAGDIDKDDAKFGDTAAWNDNTDLVDWGVAAGALYAGDIDKEDAQYGDTGAGNEKAE